MKRHPDEKFTRMGDKEQNNFTPEIWNEYGRRDGRRDQDGAEQCVLEEPDQWTLHADQFQDSFQVFNVVHSILIVDIESRLGSSLHHFWIPGIFPVQVVGISV